MPNQRIEIIIKEINYWKENKLLPDVYCDFLLALYTEGEGVKKGQVHQTQGLAPIIQLMIQTLLLLFSIIMINLKGISFLLIVMFLGLSLCIMLWMFKKQDRRHDTYFYLSTALLLVFILLVSVYISKMYIVNPWLINLVITLNLVGWFLMARKLRLKYLGAISMLSFVLMCIYAFF